MAGSQQGVFNPNIGPDQAPEFTHSSHGFQVDERGTDAFGSLFTGVGNLLKEGVSAVDSLFKTTIDQQAHEAVDPVRDKTILEYTDAIKGGGGTPPEITASTDKAALLQQAFQSGKILPSDYTAKLDSISRQLRSKYPGYRDEIDQTMSKITGMVPANELVKQLQTEASKVSAVQKEQETFINHATNEGTIPSDFYARKASGNPYSFDELRNAVATRTISKANITAAQAQLSFKGSLRQDTHEDAYSTATASTNAILSEAVNAGLSVLGPTRDAQLSKLQSLTDKNGVITAQDQEALQKSGASLRASVLDRTQRMLYAPIANDPQGKAYADYLAPGGVEKIMKQASDTVDSILDPITNKDWGIAGYNLRKITSQNNTNVATATQLMPQLQVIQTMKDIMGPEAVNLYLQSNAKGLTDVYKTMADDHFVGLMTGKYKNLTESFDEARKSNATPQTYQTILDNGLDVIGNKDVRTDARVSATKSIFGNNQNFLSSLAPESRGPTFSKMTSPAMADKIYKLANETGNQGIVNDYVTWTVNSAAALNKPVIDQVKQGNENWATAGVRFNPETLKFESYSKQNTSGIPADQLRFRQTGEQSNALDSANKLNATVDSLKPIFDREKYTPEKRLANTLAFFRSSGLEVPGFPPIEKDLNKRQGRLSDEK